MGSSLPSKRGIRRLQGAEVLINRYRAWKRKLLPGPSLAYKKRYGLPTFRPSSGLEPVSSLQLAQASMSVPNLSPRFWPPTPAEQIQAGQLISVHNRHIDKVNDAIEVTYVRKVPEDPNAEHFEERLAKAKAAAERGTVCVALEKAQPCQEGTGRVKIKVLHCTKHVNSYEREHFLLPFPHSSNAWQGIGGFEEPLEVEDSSVELGKQSYVMCFEPFFIEFNANEGVPVS